MNKAGYTAQDAPSTRLKITRDGRTDGRMDTPSYRDATAHLKMRKNGNEWEKVSKSDRTIASAQNRTSQICQQDALYYDPRHVPPD